MNNLLSGLPAMPTLPAREKTPDALEAEQAALDARASLFATQAMRMDALAVVTQFAQDMIDNDLDGDSPAQRIDLLMIKAADPDEDDADPDGDDARLQVLSAHVADALMTLGVSASVVEVAFGEDVSAANRALRQVADTLRQNLPPVNGQQMAALASRFVFGFREADMRDADEMSAFDAMSPGRTTSRTVGGRNLMYKAVVAIRNGVRAVVNRRVSGTVHLSAAQKTALARASAKSHSSAALQKRKKSVAKRKRLKPYHPADYVPASTASKAEKQRLHVAGARAKAEYEVGLRKAHPRYRG